jgi:ABC-type multidrug transport system fused ATPase/permease subunit
MKELDILSVRNRIGIVSQNTFLFRGSLLDNIKIANPSATRESIERAAELSGCNLVFDNCSNVQIEEFGRNLSEGQKQAASIARCLLKNPDLLMFDEATTHLDTETRKIVLSAIKNMFSGKIRIIITHDYEVAKIADRILLLECGEVKEITKDEALKMSLFEYVNKV